MNEVDEIDRKIMRTLQANGRASMSEIAKRIRKLSKVAVSYRVKRLMKKGVIRGFHARIDPDLIDQGFLFVTCLSIGPKGPAENAIVTKIAAVDGVQSVFQTFGQYDALVIARTQNAASARDLIYRIYRIGGIRDSMTIIPHTVIKQSLDVVI